MWEEVSCGLNLGHSCELSEDRPDPERRTHLTLDVGSTVAIIVKRPARLPQEVCQKLWLPVAVGEELSSLLASPTPITPTTLPCNSRVDQRLTQTIVCVWRMDSVLIFPSAHRNIWFTFAQTCKNQTSIIWLDREINFSFLKLKFKF